MEQSGGRRIPLSVLYGLLGLFFFWAVLYIVPMTHDLYLRALRPATVVATPFLPDWPNGTIVFVARDLDRRSVPPIVRGDRIVAVDGQPFRTAWELAHRVEAAGVTGALHVVVSRDVPGGGEEEIASTVALRSLAEGEDSFAVRVLIVVVGLVMPWVCFLVGFWVAFVRPRDPMAWLVLVTLLGFQVASFQQPWLDRWPDLLRIPGAVYRATFGGAWPFFFPLFGVYFAERLPWERRHGWIKWIVLAPVAAFAIGGIALDFGESLNLRGVAPLARGLKATQSIAQLSSMAAISFFFLVMGWKRGVASSADARRRLRFVSWGGSVALLPLLTLIVAGWVLDRRFEDFPVGVIVSGLIFIPVFPLALAYVIVVDRAIDVRVAVRQGLRYAVTRGAIRMVVMLFMAGVVWNAWNLVNNPTANRPQKIRAIALGMAAAVLVPRFARHAFHWTDRRFFREAYDVERVLTELSEQVRTIAETGPPLDTVLDRIGTTLHVERLAVFLHEGDRLVPSRSRGFDPPPTVEFPATAEALVRLRESGRPLRRETITEDNRARLAQVDAELVLPLNGKKDLLGVITLGPKKSEEPYSISDAKLLGSVARSTSRVPCSSVSSRKSCRRFQASIAPESAARLKGSGAITTISWRCPVGGWDSRSAT